MATNLDLLIEADRRGILPPEQKALLDEARRRGLTPDSGGIVRTIGQFAQGVNTRLADVYDAPRTLFEPITKPAARFIADTTKRLFGGEPREGESPSSREFDLVSRFLRSRPFGEPRGTVERIAYRTGEEVGATIPYAVLPYAGAAISRVPTTQAPGMAQQLWNTFMEGVRATPGRAAVGELAATVGAGTGAGVAQEVAPGSPVAEMTGQLVGGLTPTVIANTPTALAARGAREITKRFSPAAQTQAAKEEVGKILGAEIGPDARAKLEEAARLREQIPGFEPTLAEATGSPGLVATQRDIERRASGRELEELAGRRARSEAAIERYAATHAPAFEGSPEYVVDTAGRKVESLRQEVARPQKTILQRQQEAAAALPTVDRAAVGDTLRNKLIELRAEASARMSQLADQLGLNDVDLTIPFGQMRNQILEEFRPGSIFEDASNYPEVLDVIRKIQPVDRGPGGQFQQQRITFADIKALRERLTDDLIDAQAAANPSRKKIRLLAALRERVDRMVDDLVEQAEPGLADRWREFRRTYFEEYINRFEKGAAFKVRQKDGRGFYKIPDERVASAFFAPGDVSAARQFKAVFGADPEANAALEAVALDSLRDAAVRDGQINRTLLQTWIRRHQSVLDEFPNLRAAVSSLDRLTAALAARQAQLEGRTKAIESAMLVRELGAMERGTRTPEAIIDAALRDPRKMMQLVARLRDNPEAKGALKRHVWDRVANGTGADINAFINEHEAALRIALGAEHLGHLKIIARAREMLERVPPPAGRGYSPNPLADIERAIGMGVPQLASRIFAAESGRTSFRFVATDALGRFMRGRSQAESAALLREALYNPQVAKDMVDMLRLGPEHRAIARRLNARLFNLGLTSREQQESEQ